MRVRPDPFVVALLVAALVASFLPATGRALDVLGLVSTVVIGLLFLLYGARLSSSETWAGLTHWRLHLAILSTTFVVFPLLGLAAQLLEPSVLTPSLAAGVLLLCLVPSTVQSCVVNTRIAGGNVAGAVVSASMSNVVGVFLTPALVAWLMATDADVDAGAVVRIVLQLLAPFVLGQALRPWVGGWVTRHDVRLRLFDRSTIVLIVFVAFSKGAEARIWSSVSPGSVVAVSVVCAVVLALGIGWTVLAGRVLRLAPADRWPLLFCGSNKSLASGLPMATVLFGGSTVALIVLPLMIYHQMQIITGVLVAGRAARRQAA